MVAKAKVSKVYICFDRTIGEDGQVEIFNEKEFETCKNDWDHYIEVQYPVLVHTAIKKLATVEIR